MEYVDGGNLLDRCRAGAIPLEEAISLACQLCEGLGRAHERGIIHRDIKPANILLTSEGVPKLTDFGLAKVELGDSEMTMAGAILGTLDFMPPEQRRDATQTDARSDLWSLAATLYQMVTGESPRVIDLDSAPTELRSPLARALKTKQEDRYANAFELKTALKDCLVKTKPLAPERQIDLGAGEC
ncbi:MAG: serine/threonine-protein kinase [Pirellula sp.]|jgi:serine/threonine protein kinase